MGSSPRTPLDKVSGRAALCQGCAGNCARLRHWRGYENSCFQGGGTAGTGKRPRAHAHACDSLSYSSLCQERRREKKIRASMGWGGTVAGTPPAQGGTERAGMGDKRG